MYKNNQVCNNVQKQKQPYVEITSTMILLLKDNTPWDASIHLFYNTNITKKICHRRISSYAYPHSLFTRS